MGLIHDSTIFVHGERSGLNAWKTLSRVPEALGPEEFSISVITALELAHGVERADTSGRRATRQRFLDEVLSAVPVYPVSLAIALRAGQLDGMSKARGANLALGDLLIGMTALDLGCGVATANIRHFEMIPELRVVSV